MGWRPLEINLIINMVHMLSIYHHKFTVLGIVVMCLLLLLYILSVFSGMCVGFLCNKACLYCNEQELGLHHHCEVGGYRL